MKATARYAIAATALLIVTSVLAAAAPARGAAAQSSSEAAADLANIIDRYWQRQKAQDVYALMQSGTAVSHFPSGTVADARTGMAEARVLLKQLAGVNPVALQGEDVLSRQILQWMLEQRLQLEQRYWFEFPISTYTNYELQTAGFALEENKLATVRDRRAYVDLLDSYAAWLTAAKQRLHDQAARHIVLPKAVLPGAIDHLEALEADLRNWSKSVERRTQALDAKERVAFANEVAAHIRERIRPAFASLLTYLRGDYAKLAPEAIGIGQYPGGKAFYRYLVRYHTSLDYTPEAVSAYGQARLDQINAEIDKLVAQLHIAGGRQHLREAVKAQQFIAKSPDDVARHYQLYLRRIEPLIPKYFSVVPQAPYGVRRLDPAEEAGSAFGDYYPPTAANPRGEYRFNGSKLQERSMIAAVAIIYHELVPGHHFALALQGENHALPQFRRQALDFGAYNEGWAEYAAGLAQEMGLLDDPYDRLGRLMFDSFLTARLLVDPGINYFGWSLQQARAFLRENTYISDTEIETETLRYSTADPGQADAYKIGHRDFLELRAWAQKRAGASFDIREFHREVLGHGAMPLSVLNTYIHDYYDKRAQIPAAH